MAAAPQTRTHPAQHCRSAQKPFLLLHCSQSSQFHQETAGGFRARSGAAHLGHSLQVPAGDDGPAAVPAGKEQLRGAGLLGSTSASPGLPCRNCCCSEPAGRGRGESQPGPGSLPEGSAALGFTSRLLQGLHRGGERDGTAGKRREGG